MSRTTRFQILVVLQLPTFDPNFATLMCVCVCFALVVCLREEEDEDDISIVHECEPLDDLFKSFLFLSFAFGMAFLPIL